MVAAGTSAGISENTMTVLLANTSPSSSLAMWGSRSSPRVYRMAR